MTSIKLITVAALAMTAMASPTLVHAEAGKITGTIFGGAEFPVGGTVHTGATSAIADLGALNPALAGVPATLNIEKRSQNAVYDRAWTLGAELAYGLNDNGQILAQFRYSRANGNRIQVGTAVAGAPVNATLPVFGTFSDAKTFSGEVGYRQFFGSTEGVRPYLAGKVGAAKRSKVNATFEIPDAAITIANAPFTRASWVFSAGADAGVSIPVSPAFSLQAETGLRYQGGLRDNDTALSGLGLAAINDDGKRWSVPLTVRATFKF